MRVATYNVHDCVGQDGRYDPARINRILIRLNADVIALQEIALDHAGDLLDQLHADTKLHPIDGSLFERGVGRYGNVLLTRVSARHSQVIDLSLPGCEPRGAIEAKLMHEGKSLRCVATHLGLSRRERVEQIIRLAIHLSSDRDPLLMLGDFNLWLHSKALAPLREMGLRQCAVRSFPTRPIPMVSLDRVLVSAPLKVASDHYPIVADVSVEHL